ncbi:DUF6286 domain-containing protein [Dietzia sp.]|uniref:DUF6286 domain-containing protein n=1 Tax=Dietzia sp. TaxID=1871616 RepID=UPI002FD9C309
MSTSPDPDPKPAAADASEFELDPAASREAPKTVLTNQQLADSPNAAAEGKRPRRAPAARPVLVLLSLVLLALAVFAGYELYATLREDWVPLLGPQVEKGLDAPADWRWLSWIAGVVAFIGLLMVIAALRPRSRSHIGYGTDNALWLGPTSVARLCSQAAGRVSGVTGATTYVGRRKITSTVFAGGRDPEDVALAVRQEIAPIVGALEGNRTLVVKMRGITGR